MCPDADMVDVTVIPRVKTETATVHSPISKCGDNWWRDVKVRSPYKGIDTAYRTLPSLGDPSQVEKYDAEFLDEISGDLERVREFSIKVSSILSDRQRKNIDKMLRRAAQYIRDAETIQSTWARGFATSSLGTVPAWPLGGQPRGGINGNIEEGHARDGQRWKQLVRAALRNVRCAEEVAKKGTIRDRNKNSYKGARFGSNGLGISTGPADEGPSEDDTSGDSSEDPAPTGGIAGAKTRATQDYNANQVKIDRAIRKYLDQAAVQKGIVGGWSGVSPMMLQTKQGSGSTPDRGPQYWSQKETWWAATRAFDEVFPQKEPYTDVSIAKWASGINPQFVVDDAWLMGMIMRKAMSLTGAEPVISGTTKPDWGIFLPYEGDLLAAMAPEDDELETGDIDLEDEADPDSSSFPEPTEDESLPAPEVDAEVTAESEAKKTTKKKDNTLLIAGAAAIGLLAFSRK